MTRTYAIRVRNGLGSFSISLNEKSTDLRSQPYWRPVEYQILSVFLENNMRNIHRRKNIYISTLPGRREIIFVPYLKPSSSSKYAVTHAYIYVPTCEHMYEQSHLIIRIRAIPKDILAYKVKYFSITTINLRMTTAKLKHRSRAIQY